MTIFYPSNHQRIILEGSQTVLDINDYWKSGEGKTFPNQYTALLGVNEKARQILNNFTNQEPPPPDIVRKSLQNLISSYQHCSRLLRKMKEKKIDTFAHQFYSVEFIVTGLDSCRENQLETIPKNVEAFESQMTKTAQFEAVFEDIVNLSRWPAYRDIVVETTITGEFTAKKHALYQTIEVTALTTLILLVIVWFVYKVTQAYFPRVPGEPI